jgi:transposase
MGEINQTYSVKFKAKAVEMYLNVNMGYKTIAKKLGIQDTW